MMQKSPEERTKGQLCPRPHTNVKVQPFPADRASIHPYLKEEITPGGIHPEWGHNPKQTGSKEGREEGDGAEEEALRLLLRKHNLRPVSARPDQTTTSDIPLESTPFWN